MSKKAYIFLADGFEDIEGLTVVDLLRRAGIDIKTVSIKETTRIQTSHEYAGGNISTINAPNMDTNGNNHCDYMYGAVSVVIYYWHDQKICSCNNRYFFDCYCVTASYYHQKHNQSGVHNASYLSCYCYRHCYTTYL